MNNKQSKIEYTESIYKNSGTIAISNNITLLQRKLFNFLVGHAFVDLGDTEVFEISLSSLKNRLWFNSWNNKYLQESLKKLIITAVEFNLLNKDKEDWEASALLASVRFKQWVCYYSFSPLLREKLHAPNIYSKLNLSLVKLFSSKYSLSLYELSMDYIKINATPFVSISVFKKLMGVSRSQYTEFKRLKSRVIEPAIKELNTVAWFTIALEYKKEGRKIVAIKFLLHDIKINMAINNVDPTTQDNLVGKIHKNFLLQKSLISDYGLTLRQANKAIKEYPAPYIKESLEIIRLKKIHGSIKNIPAYTLTVLKNDYQTINIPREDARDWKEQSLLWDTQKCLLQTETGWGHKVSMEDGKSISKDSLLSTSNCMKNNKDWAEVSLQKPHRKKTNKYSQTTQGYLDTLSSTEKDKLIREFEKEKVSSPILWNLYERKGLDDPLFRVIFDGWVGAKL